jgi:hypothetical protein
MSNERDAETNLWAAGEGSATMMRVRGAVLDYAMVEDFLVHTNA